MKLVFTLLIVIPLTTCSPKPQASSTFSRAAQQPIASQAPHQPNSDSNLNFNLNPDWSPDPNNIAPISNDGMSPWDDSGLSEVMDFQPVWVNCPQRYLNCRKCPRDFRCRRSPLTTPAPQETPQPQLQPTQEQAPQDEGEFNALTGPQLAGFDLTKYACPIKKCSNATGEQCGARATCTNSYCVCRKGVKARDGSGVRGSVYPESLAVFVNPGVRCNLPCQNWTCGDVRCAQECDFSGKATTQSTEQVGSEDQGATQASWQVHGALQTGAKGQENSETLGLDNGAHGAIQYPGAAMGGSPPKN